MTEKFTTLFMKMFLTVKKAKSWDKQTAHDDELVCKKKKRNKNTRY